MRTARFGSDQVRLDAAVAGPEGAIRAAGELLVAAGAATPSYVDAMVDALARFGPYMVVAPGIAMPHARPGEGGLKDAFSVVRLAEPVNFGNQDNDPVRLVVALVGAGDHEHLELLRLIASVLGDVDARERLLTEGDPSRVVAIFEAAEAAKNPGGNEEKGTQ